MIGRRTFFIIELILGVTAAVLLVLMFSGTTEKQTVAVVVSDPESDKWTSFFNGIRQGASDKSLDVMIEDTENVWPAEETRQHIGEILDEGADALIAEAADGDAKAAVSQNTPLIMVNADGYALQEQTDAGCISFDGYAMGKQLAEEFRADYGGNLSGKTIGILGREISPGLTSGCEQGFLDGTEGSGVRVLWTIRKSGDEAAEALSMADRVDIVIALDTESCETAGSCAEGNELCGAMIYGTGSSAKTVYYLDQGLIRGLIVPDGFAAGYQCMEELARRLDRGVYEMKDIDASWRYLRREDLFAEENQMLIFGNGSL